MIADPLTGEQTLLGATRDGRPNEFRHGAQERCPFCPGNEDLTPPEIARVDGTQGWAARAFRNLFPAIGPPDGDHEVIVDSPTHDVEISASGVELWRDRYRASLERMPSSFPVLFKNRGAYAGATILHPHTQLIVVPARPVRWRSMLQSERCALCEEREAAVRDGLVVLERDRCSAFVRSRSRFSSTLTIASHRCTPSLLDDDGSWIAAVSVLRTMTEALLSHDASTPFNVLFYSDPHGARFHWNIELLPRYNTLAGFELSTGAFIRGARAQESATAWRRMLGPSNGSL